MFFIQNNKSCHVNVIGNDELEYPPYMLFIHAVQFGIIQCVIKN